MIGCRPSFTGRPRRLSSTQPCRARSRRIAVLRASRSCPFGIFASPTVTQVELPPPVARSGRGHAPVRRHPWSPGAQLTEDARWSGPTTSLRRCRIRSRTTMNARRCKALGGRTEWPCSVFSACFYRDQKSAASRPRSIRLSRPDRVGTSQPALSAIDATFVTNGEQERVCPPNGIAVNDRMLLGIVRRLCRDSVTFRRQCTRIGAHPSLAVEVRLKSPAETSGPRAWTTFAIVSSPRGRADVRITAGPGAAELFGHEFEHIVEWLDGVHDRHASTTAAGVTLDNHGGISETARATRVGRIVARESAAATRRPDPHTFEERQ